MGKHARCAVKCQCNQFHVVDCNRKASLYLFGFIACLSLACEAAEWIWYLTFVFVFLRILETNLAHFEQTLAAAGLETAQLASELLFMQVKRAG